MSYSPSQTVDYLTCPTYWGIKKKWSERAEWSPPLHLGAAMAAALAVFRTHPTEEGYGSALKAARVILDERWEDNLKWPLEALCTLLQKGFDKAIEKLVNPQLEFETNIDNEKEIGEARLDWVSQSRATGDLIVTDDKVKVELKSYYITKELMGAEQDWQLRDYAWRASNYYGRPVKWIRRNMIILSPKVDALSQIFPVSPESIKAFEVSAGQYWNDMEFDEGREISNLQQNLLSCNGRYGKCRVWDACHVAYRDEKLFPNFLDRKELHHD